MIKKILKLLLGLTVLLVVATPLLTLLRGQPTVAVIVKSWSMTPLLNRGDLVFILPVSDESSLSDGQLVVFRSPEQGNQQWTLHRIVGGDAKDGFITQGDANIFADQEDGSYPLVAPEWIGGSVPTVGDKPLKIPLVGHLALFMERHLAFRGSIPILVGILAAVLGLDEILKSRKRRRREALSKSQLYFLGGVAVAVLMGALMLGGSLFLTFPYGVDDSPGVLMGSDVGILKQGDSRDVSLAKIENRGRIPTFYHAVSSDPQVVLHQTRYRLGRGESAEIAATVYGCEPGLFQSNIAIGLFMPFLPQALSGYLAEKNFWLGLIAVSLVPALPVMVFPYLDPRCRRRFRVTWSRCLEKAAAILKY